MDIPCEDQNDLQMSANHMYKAQTARSHGGRANQYLQRYDAGGPWH